VIIAIMAKGASNHQINARQRDKANDAFVNGISIVRHVNMGHGG